MALIKNSKGKENSGYVHIFGNEKLGRLISRVHSVSNKNGQELKNLIKKYSKQILIDKKKDIDKQIKEFLNSRQSGIYLLSVGDIKHRKKLKGMQPDFIIFNKINNKNLKCYLLKVTDSYRISKPYTTTIIDSMEKFKFKHINFHYKYYCCFNESTKNQVRKGFGNKIRENQCLTGKDLCKLLKINYQEIKKIRQKDQKDNLNYFVQELKSIFKL